MVPGEDQKTAAIDSTVVDGRLPRAHRHTLIEMNRPVFTARRDAAHHRVMEILQRQMLTSTKEKRSELYGTCLRLLDEALSATRRSQVQKDSPVLHYLDLLSETVGACLALVRHELTLVQEAEEFSRLLGRETVEQLQTATDVFSASEMNVLDCIDGLRQFGGPIMAQDTKERRQRFDQEDRKRYQIALREYTAVYGSRSRDEAGT